MANLDIAGIFTSAGQVVTGVVDGGLQVLTTMWANPIGQVTILSGLAATVIGFGLSIVTHKRKMK